MKFKYYLRGAGVGIIVTTLIFTIALLRYEPTLSADEIREKAAKLGMVMPEETASGDAKEQQMTEDKGSTEDGATTGEVQVDQNESQKPGENKDSTKDSPAMSSDTEPDTKTEKEEVTTIRFVIKGGQFSDVVSNNLAAKGLVPDGEEYNDWLMDHHYDSSIQPGVYYIKSDATYKEIAEMITAVEE